MTTLACRKSTGFSMNMVIVVSIFLFAFGVKISETSGILSFGLETFNNPTQRDLDGKCCDGDKNAFTCTSDCDIYLIVCLSSSNVTNRCDHGELWMGDGSSFPTVFGNKIIIPETSPAEYHDNPYEIKFSKWNGSFSFKIGVFDEDGGGIDRLNHNDNDKVDELIAYFRSNAFKNASTARKQTFNLEGKNVKMRVSAKVWCDKYYLIPDCTEHCKDTNDSSGHFRCNYDYGTRECLKGWYGENCNKTRPKCHPRDNEFGHYVCNATSGEKICLDGWFNPDVNCTKEIKNLNSTSPVSLHTTIYPTSSINIPDHNHRSQSTSQSHVVIHHSIPKLESKDFAAKQETKNSETFDSNFIVYFAGLILFAILLVSAFVGIWKLVPTFKKFRAVAPAGEAWQKTRRKRTISTKTGMPPTSSTKISFQATNYDENTQKTGMGCKRSVIQVKSFDSDPGSKKAKLTANHGGKRKVTFANMNSSVV